MRTTVVSIALGILTIVFVGTGISSPEWAEEESEHRFENEHRSEDHERGFFSGGWLESRADLRPIENATYRSECGGCHFAYQPGLLPGRDWVRIMDALERHYGDDASLDGVQATEIRTYLLENAADRSSESRARAFSAGSRSRDDLPRITATDYFRREHHEIPGRLVRDNTAVGSFSNCQACHRTADSGIYNEHQVVIPGVGRWDD